MSTETGGRARGEAPARAASESLERMPKYVRLRRWNGVMAVLHLLQGVAMVVLAEDVAWPITRTRYDFDVATETLSPVTIPWIDAPLPLLVAGFLLLSALAHVLIATVLYPRYVASLERGMNPYRWYEYSLSASLMIVVIGMLSGIWDLGTLVAFFGLVAVMNLCGLVMERQNQSTESVDWTAYWVGTIAGAIPWVVIGIVLVGSFLASAGQVPDFVIFIYVSIFVFFNLFAVNMILQYREVGRWRDYLFGERVYILLSLFAKSALAWQVYFGTLNSPV